MPRPPRGRRTTTVVVGLLAVIVLAGTALWLEVGATGPYQVLLEVAESGAEPAATLTAAGRAHRFLFIADVPASDAPDRLAGATIESLARTVGLDAVVVAVSEDHQPLIDRYMAMEAEDASGLVARPDAAGGPGTPLLPLYRRIRSLNQQLGAARSVRIVAADMPGWPPARAMAPAQAVLRWAERDAHMARVVSSRVLSRDSRARVVFFMNGLHALRAPIELRTGGTAPVPVMPLAARLAATAPREVWSALLDVPPVAASVPAVAVLVGSGARETLRRETLDGRAFVVPVTSQFGAASDWLAVRTQPGVTFSLADPDVPLAGVVDAYVHLIR